MSEQEFILPQNSLLQEAEKLKVSGDPTEGNFFTTYTIPEAQVESKPVNIEFSLRRGSGDNKPHGNFLVRSEATHPIFTSDYDYALNRQATPEEILLMVRLLTYRYEAQKEDFQTVGRDEIDSLVNHAEGELERARKQGLGEYIQARKRWSSISSQASKALPQMK